MIITPFMAAQAAFTAGSSAFSFFGGRSAAYNAAKAAAKYAKRTYKEQETLGNKRRYQKQKEYDNLFAQAAFQQQGLRDQLLRVQGANTVANASVRNNYSAQGMITQRAGRSQQRNEAEVLGSYGREMTKLAMNKVASFDQYNAEMEAIADQQRAANQSAYYGAKQMIASNPAPSALGMLANAALKIGQDVMGSLPENPLSNVPSGGGSADSFTSGYNSGLFSNMPSRPYNF